MFTGPEIMVLRTGSGTSGSTLIDYGEPMKAHGSLYLLGISLLDLRTVPWALQAFISFILTPSLWIKCCHVRDQGPGVEMRSHLLKVIHHNSSRAGQGFEPRERPLSSRGCASRQPGQNLTALRSAISLTN